MTNWIPISDGPPKIDTNVLVTIKDDWIVEYDIQNKQ